ncbi:hypothetical protein [Niallia taxi]
MSKFIRINAKVCPVDTCNQIIPEEWTASYNDEWCPKCGFGLPDKKE